jgi:hypothetical protein
MSDPTFDDQVDVYSMVPSHLFTFQKMLAVTNFLVPVTKPPLNVSRTIAVGLNRPGHSHTPHCTANKEKVVFETAEKYYETVPTFSVCLFGSTMLLKVLPNRLQQAQSNPTAQEFAGRQKAERVSFT